MARNLEELRRQILRLAPWWLREPEEVMDAALRSLAAIYERVEGAIETLHDRTFIDRADGSWLDEHGFERSRERRASEDDESYRPRVKSWPDAVTLPVLLEAANGEVEVGDATIEEWLGDSPYALPNGSELASNFVSVAHLYEQRRGFTIFIDPQSALANETAWAVADGAGSVESFATLTNGAGSWPDDPGSFADRRDPTPSPIYTRLYERIAELKAAGVPFVIVVGSSIPRGA